MIEFEYKDMLMPKDAFSQYITWSAGSQIQALKFYLRADVKVIRELQQEWSGTCYVLMKYKRTFVLWRDSFGSCSGCDNIDGDDVLTGYDYIASTMTEGNCKRFKTIEEMEHWLLNAKEYLWEYLRNYYPNFKESVNHD